MSILLDKALELTIPERIQLVEDLWDSIALESGAVDLSDEQLSELARRVKEYHENPAGNVPWEMIKAEALGRR
ncbi:MAG: addiction module protein [Acidobacteria bacterium]|nr:addiction module protein [Acidobacteriota bacterium]